MYEPGYYDPADVFDQMHHESMSLPGYMYQNGTTFTATDLGGRGVKVELGRSWDSMGAVILPTGEVKQCGEFVLEAVGCNKYGLPHRVTEILRRVLKDPRASQMLQRGDKARIKEALELLEG